MRVIFLDIDGVLNCKPTPNPRKVPYIIATLERLTALQQGIRRRDTGIVEICRASPVNGSQAPTRRSPAFTPRPRQRDADGFERRPASGGH
jgi:hypothetical protein